jgi:hypothetical protein
MMKKQFLKLTMALVALPVLFSLTSCDKDSDAKNTTPATELGKATISGVITGNLDLTNSVANEGIAGVTVTVWINNNDLINNYTSWWAGQAAEGYRTYTAVTDADGKYSVSVDVGSKPVEIRTLYPAIVRANQKNELGGTTEVDLFIQNNPNWITLYKGQVYNQNINYRSDNQPEMGKMTLKGDLKFRNDMCVSGDAQFAVVPSTTKLLIQYNNDYGQSRQLTIPVDANGKYEFSIESVNNNVNFNVRGISFSADRKSNPGSGCETQNNYTYQLFGGGSQNENINKNEVKVRDYNFQ